jgi:PAS domain S-box-containing protein/putative nucleotidyltransferase with HDIG domain
MLESYHLLLVDDDPNQVELIRHFFFKQSPNAKITVAENGRVCLEKLSKTKFSVVLLDYSLPVMDGLRVFEEIQRQKHDVPVIIVTGRGSESIAVEAMKKGAYDYVVKKSGYEKFLPTIVEKTIERHFLKTRLAQSEERYQRLVECAADVVCLVDLKGKILMINDQIERLSGYLPNMLIGKPLLQLIPPEDQILFQKNFKEVSDGLRVRLENRILHKENTKNWVSISGGPLLEGGSVSGAIFILRDITEQKQTEMELVRKNKELRLLLEVGNALVSNRQLDQLLEIFAKHHTEAIVTTYSRIFLLRGDKLVVKAVYPIRGFNWNPGLEEAFSVNALPKIKEILGEKRSIVMTPEMLHDICQFDQIKKFLMSDLNGIQSVALVPLFSKEEILGMVVLGERRKWERNPLTDSQIALCEAIAHQAAIAVENARLFQDLQGAHFDTIQALAETLETKDAYTKTHSDHTLEYAMALAEKLNLSESEKELLKYAAIFHDIGKIGIPDSILNKPAKLTDEEYAVMKTHPELGANILRQIKFLAPVVPMVLYHQEMYNGKGYPAGLAGDAIPIQSRIVAVLDAYDAMTSNRVYRKSPGKAYAISELKKYAGSQFDPKVVEAFLQIIRDGDEP